MKSEKNLEQNPERPIDTLAKQSYSWWTKNLVLIGKTKVKTWQAVFAIAFIAGIAVALVLTLSLNLQTTTEAADLQIPRNSCIAEPPGGTFLKVTGVNIFCGEEVREAKFQWDDQHPKPLIRVGRRLMGWTLYRAKMDQVLKISGKYKQLLKLKSFTKEYYFKRGVGTLTISISPESPKSGLLIGGSTNSTLVVFNIEALGEDITLDELKLTPTDGMADRFSPNDVDTLYLYNEMGQLIASQLVSSESVIFKSLSYASTTFTVANGESKRLYVKADLSPIGVSYPGTSGHYVGYKVGSASDFVGIGSKTGQATEVIGTGVAAPIGNIFMLVKAAPVIEALSVSGFLHGREINKTIFKFKIRADAAGGDLGLYKMMFKVSSGGASTSNFYLYDVTTGETNITYSLTPPQLDAQDLLSLYLDGDGNRGDKEKEERVVSRGMSRIYELRADTWEDPGSSGDGVITYMLYDVTADMYPTDAEEVDKYSTSNHFIWTDRSASPHATSTRDWYNSYLVTGTATSTAAILRD